MFPKSIQSRRIRCNLPRRSWRDAKLRAILGFRGVLRWLLHGKQEASVKQIGNVAVNETFAGITDDYIGNNWPWPSPLASDATSQGTFVDIICMVDPALTPPSLPPRSLRQLRSITRCSLGSQAV